ncbi:MAG: 5-dehydro-2-deoxygluconokinase [Pseudomonadota bacterium]
MKDLEAITAGIATKKFIVIGRVGMDVIADPPGSRTEHMEQAIVAMGGSSANIAAGLVKLGAAADLVTRVSDDSIGRYCTNQLKKYGVGTKHVKPIGGENRSSLAVYESTVQDHQTVIYRNGAADFQLSNDDVDAVDFSAYGALITAGTVFAAEPSRSAVFRAFELAKKAGLPIIFDIDYRPYSWPSPEIASDVLSRAGAASDVIVGNDVEFGFMAGDYDQGLQKARSLLGEGTSLVIYKMGENGAMTFAGDAEIKTGIFPVDALKPEGAGDSFMAGLVASLADGYDLEEAVLRGSACASITVSKPACSPAMPYLTDLDQFLATHPGPTHHQEQQEA